MTTMDVYAESEGYMAKRVKVDYETAAAVVAGPSTASSAPVSKSLGGVLSSQHVDHQLNRRPKEPEKPNHILLFTVLNPTYPITCQVISTICSPFGNVLRVVIFRKNGVQAMVEFQSVETASSVKERLHGCDIYSGCCTLKVEFAKPSKLNVYRNDTFSWDYTIPNTSTADQTNSNANRPVLLKEPLASRGGTNSNGTNGNNMASNDAVAAAVAAAAGYDGKGLASTSHQQQMCLAAGLDPSSRASIQATNLMTRGAAMLPTPLCAGGSVTTLGASSTPQRQGSVCMVYGLTQELMNTNRLFNLFCLYGNVIRIKFLKTKEGCAMVQMGDALSVERLVCNLSNTTIFGCKLQLGFSKQAFLADVMNPYQLPDGSPSFQDFMCNRNNRFMNMDMASKNRIQPPSRILHFFNTPPAMFANDVEAIFVNHSTPKPKCVKMFPSKTDRSSSGLIEFESQSDALEALVSCNHEPIQNPCGKFPYIMKLCFSSSRNIPANLR